jgi:hypothetical protein
VQFWIYFDAGAGGDGFANLLEHADNITPWDQDLKVWRFSHYVNNEATFYAPPIDHNGCFRTPKNGRSSSAFRCNENVLHESYVDRIQKNINTVCTSHDVTKKYLHASDRRDILEHNQISVYLFHPSYRQCSYQAALKNLIPKLPPKMVDNYYQPVRKNINIKQFDFVLNIEQIQADPSALDQFCNTVGLNLNPERFQEYSKLQKGDDSWYHYSNFRPKKYRSTTIDDNTFYKEI